MAISPIVLQRRHAELGRIRLGYKKAITKRDGEPGTAPVKLQTFRFTSPSERYIRDLATLYGGEAREWDNDGKAEWEVYSEAKSIPVIVVKGGLSQYLEHWSGGGCQRRCDGEHELIKDRDCICDPADRLCKPTTRLSAMLPELEALGVWRLESKGWNSAAEIPAVAELAQFVGDLVPAHLNLVERRSVRDGKTSRFVVPVLDLQIGTQRLKELVAERSGMKAIEGSEADQPAAIEAAGAGGDAYSSHFAQVAAAGSLDDLSVVWEEARQANLVGTSSTASARREEFTAAFRKRASEVKDSPGGAPDGEEAGASPSPASSSPQPDADGVYPARVIEDAEVVWEHIVKVGGDRDMTLADIEDDFARQMGGLSSADASAEELDAYLKILTARPAA